MQDINLNQLRNIQNKFAEFFETEYSVSVRANEVRTFLEENAGFILRTGISEKYFAQILQAYSALIKDPYHTLYDGERKKFFNPKGELVEKDQLTQEDINSLAENIRLLNRSATSVMQPRLAAQAFITLHLGTVETFLKEIEKYELPLNVKLTLNRKIKTYYMDPVQRPSRVGLLFKDLLELWDIEAFRSMDAKIQSFIADIEFLIDLGDFIPNKETLSQIITLDHLSHAAEVNLDMSILVNSQKVDEEGNDFLVQSIIMQHNIPTLEHSVNFYRAQLEKRPENALITNQKELELEVLVRKFKEDYALLSANNLTEDELKGKINALKAQLNLIVQKTLQSYLELFKDLQKEEFKILFKKIQTSLRELKEFLIEQRCPIKKTTSLRTMRAGVNKHLDFILQYVTEEEKEESSIKEIDGLDPKINKIWNKLVTIFGSDDLAIELKGKGRYGTYYCLTFNGTQYGIKLNDDMDALQEETRFDNQLKAGPYYGHYEVEHNQEAVGFNIIPHHQGIPSNRVDFTGLSDSQKLKFIQGLLKELKRVHTAGILHRDLKLDNIIYDEVTGQVKIIDFGRAIFMGDAEESKFLLNRNWGLFRYFQLNFQPQVAPEHYTLDFGITYAADIYSLANIIGQVYPELMQDELFSLLKAEDPFKRPTLTELSTVVELKIQNILVAQMFQAMGNLRNPIVLENVDPEVVQNDHEMVGGEINHDEIINEEEDEEKTTHEKNVILDCGLNQLVNNYRDYNLLSRNIFFNKRALHTEKGLEKAQASLLFIKHSLFSKQASKYDVTKALYDAIQNYSYPADLERAHSLLAHLKALYKEIMVMNPDQFDQLFDENSAGSLSNIVAQIKASLDGPNKLTYFETIKVYYNNHQPVVVVNPEPEGDINQRIHVSFTGLFNHYESYNRESRGLRKFFSGQTASHTDKGIENARNSIIRMEGLLFNHRLHDENGDMEIDNFLEVLKKTIESLNGNKNAHSWKTYLKILHDKVVDAKSETNKTLSEILEEVEPQVSQMLAGHNQQAEDARILAWSRGLQS